MPISRSERTTAAMTRAVAEGPCMKSCLMVGYSPVIAELGVWASLHREEVASFLVEEFQGASTATGHAGQRVLRDDDGQAGFLFQ